jgi:hypothetical protein
MEESVRRSTRRVLPWHGKSLEYLEGTAKKMEGGHVWLTWFMKQKGLPLPRDFTKKAL